MKQSAAHQSWTPKCGVLELYGASPLDKTKPDAPSAAQELLARLLADDSKRKNEAAMEKQRAKAATAAAKAAQAATARQEKRKLDETEPAGASSQAKPVEMFYFISLLFCLLLSLLVVVIVKKPFHRPKASPSRQRLCQQPKAAKVTVLPERPSTAPMLNGKRLSRGRPPLRA